MVPVPKELQMPGSETNALPTEKPPDLAISSTHCDSEGEQRHHTTGTTVDDRDRTTTHHTRVPLQSFRRNLVTLLVLFVVSLLFMAVLFSNFPELEDEDVSTLRLPRTINDAKELGRLLSKYKNTHYFTVLGTVFATYIFLQTFAIPGSIFLSILSGFLFPFPLALFLVCTCSATGAFFCYLLSSMVAHGIVNKYFPERIQRWRAQAAHHHDDMLWYIIFLRITPFLPNWFINLASPIVGVRVLPFYWGTFFGVAPPSFFFIRAGTTLYQLTTATGHISIQSIAILAALAILSLMPVFFKKALRRKLE